MSRSAALRSSDEAQSFFPLWASSDHFARGRTGTSSCTTSPRVSPSTEYPASIRRPVTRKAASYQSTSLSSNSVRLTHTAEAIQVRSKNLTGRPSDRLQRATATDDVLSAKAKRTSSMSERVRKLMSGHSLFTSATFASNASTLGNREPQKPRISSQKSWRKRQRTKSSIKKTGKLPMANTVTGLMKSKRPALPQKLQPPKSRTVSHIPQHRVEVETDFPDEQPSPKVERQSFPRHASLHGKRALDRSRRIVHEVHEQLPYHRKNSHEPERSHPMTGTDATIHRASSILFQIVEDATPGPRGKPKIEIRSGSTSGSSPNDAYRLELNRSVTRSTLSYTSSVRELRRGVVPAVSPDPDATYRVRLHPDGPSEEFLKIDISEPGGTSYLPSEARRIHTPPLPGEGPNQKRRGFFFDYNAPQSAQTVEPAETAREDVVPSFLDRMQSSIVDHGTHTHPRRDSSQSSHPTTIGTLYLPRNSIIKTRRKLGDNDLDWYNTQLLELDKQDSRRPVSQRRQSASGSSGAYTDRSNDGIEIDHRIPDHYPTSPLCPRNPKHKSKGQGICWMHGRNPAGWSPDIELIKWGSRVRETVNEEP